MAKFARQPLRYTTEQERIAKIETAALAEVAAANVNQRGTRFLPNGTALKVVRRSLANTEGKTFSERKNQALSDLSEFINLYQRNKVVSRVPYNTDLLPLAHPLSSREHSLSTADLLRAKARWYTDDPEIYDDTVRSLVASALTSLRNTPEHDYATARLSGLPAGQISSATLLASYKGGNSWAARSARARAQRRDRYGRFAWMGGGFSFIGIDANGTGYKVTGRVVGWGDGNTAWVELPDASIAKVEVRNGEAVKAVIDPPNAGKDWTPEPTAIDSKDPLVTLDSMEVRKAPPGFSEDSSYTGPNADVKRYYGQRLDYGTKYTDDAYDVIVFDTPNQYAADEFEVAQQREGEGKDVVTRGRGEDGGLNPNRPVMFVRRRDDEYDDMDFAVVQSWADVQMIIQEDEPKYKKGEPPTPTADGFQDKEEGTEYDPEDLTPDEAPEPAPEPEQEAEAPEPTPEPEAAPEPEAPAAPKVRRIAPGDGATRDEIDNLPAGTVVKKDSKAYEKDLTGGSSWYEVDPTTGSKVTNEDGFISPARLPDGDFEVDKLPGYDENAPGTGIVESVQINKPREGDFIKTKDGEWTKVVKLDRERSKRASDKAGRRPITEETFDYTYENGDGHTAQTTNGGLGFDQGKERLEIVRAADMDEEPTPEAPEAEEPEATEAPSGLKPSISAEEIQNIKEQSMLDHIVEQGRFPLPRNALGNYEGKSTDISEGAKRDYKKTFDLLSERNPDIPEVGSFNEAYPDFDAFWDKVYDYGVNERTRAFDSLEDIPEEMKIFNRAYAESVLGMDPDGELTLYRNVINNPLTNQQAGTGYWSTDRDFAQDYGATEAKNNRKNLNGFYTGKFRPDQIGGMLGYSQTEDEFAVVIGPDVAGEEGRVTRIADIKGPELPDFLLDRDRPGRNVSGTFREEMEASKRTGGTPFRFNSLAGAMNFSKVDNNPMGDGKLDDFLTANGITREDWAARYDQMWGEGAYAEGKEAGNNPSFQDLQKSFIQDEDGKWFLDVAGIINPEASSLISPSYTTESGNPEDFKNDKFDAKMKMLALVQDITGEEFMSERKYDVPEVEEREEVTPEAEAPEAPEVEEAPTPEAEEIEEGEFTPDELAIGYGAFKTGEGEYAFEGEGEEGGDVIVEALPRDRWNVRYRRALDPAGIDVIDEDLDQFDTPEEAFDFASTRLQTPRQFDPEEAVREREEEEAEQLPEPEEERTPEPEEEEERTPEEPPAEEDEAPEAEREETAPPIDVPEGYYPIDPTEEWEPEGAAEDQESPDFTDDPVELAERYSEERLTEALRQGVEGTPAKPANGFGFLDFEDGDEAVPAEAIYNALIEQGADAAGILRRIYSGDATPEPELEEAPEPEEADITLEDLADPSSENFEWPAALESLSDDEKREIIEGENGWLDTLSENAEFDAPEGYSLPESDPFPINQSIRPEDAPDWFPDSPLSLAGFAQGDYLEQALRESMRPDAENPGFAEIGFETEDGESYTALIPSEAVRDALQLQGIDTNEIIEEELQSAPTPEEVDDALEGEGIDEYEAPEAREFTEGQALTKADIDDGAAGDLPAGTILAREDGWRTKKALDGRWYVIPQGKKTAPFGRDTITDNPQGDDDWTIETIGTNESLDDLTPIQQAKELNFQVNKLRKDIRDIPQENVEERQAAQQKIDELEGQLFEVWGDARQAFALIERRKQLGELRKRTDLTDEQKEELEKAWNGSYDALVDLRDSTTDKMSKADGKRPPKIGPEPSKPEYEEFLKPFDFEEAEEVKDSEDIAEEAENFPPYGMPGSDEVPNALPDSLPEGWTPVEGQETTMAQFEDTGDYVGLVDREGAKYWFVLTGNSDDNKVFKTPEEAFEHYDKLRESIADVGDEQEPKPATDIEPPAAAEDLPDAGDTEVVDTRPEPDVADAPAGPPEPPEVEEGEGPSAVYRWKNGLATLAQRKGAPFRNNPELKEYLASKGFTFYKEYNGKKVFSEVAELSLPEFKEVLRTLRDRFDLRLSPRFEGEDIDIDAPDTEEAEAPEAAETKTVEPGGRVSVESVDFDKFDETRTVRPGTVAAEDLDEFNSLLASKLRLFEEYKNASSREDKREIYVSYLRVSQDLDKLFTREEPQQPVASRFGGEISNDWVNNDDNTFNVNDAPIVGDIQVGDFIPAADGGWHEVIDLEPDPDDPDGTIVTKMRLSNGEVFRGRKTTKRSPGLGWANGREISGLRRRKDFEGLTRDEIEEKAVKTVDEMMEDAAPTPEPVKARPLRPSGPYKILRPLRPAFLGEKVRNLIKSLKKKNDGASLAEALKGERVVYFDFETIGTGKFDYDAPDQPIALAARIFENGEQVDEVNLFINPGVPLAGYYHEGGDTNNPMKEGRMLDADGNPITNEWLATQPGIKEQLEKFIELAGPDAIFVAQNAEFDTNTLEYWLKQNGVDFTAENVIDTSALAQTTFANLENRKLGTLIEALGIEADPDMWHNANADARVLPELLDGLLRRMSEDDREWDFEREDIAFESGMATFEAMNARAAARGSEETNTPQDADDLDIDSKTNEIESIFGDKISNEWVENDENTEALSGMKTQDLQIGDFIGAKDGGWHEVVGLEADPVNEDAIIITKKRLSNGEVHRGNKTATKDGRLGWFKKTPIEKVRRRKKPVTTEIVSDKPIFSVVPSRPTENKPTNKSEAATVVGSGIDEAIDNDKNVSETVNSSEIEAASVDSPEDVVIDPNRESFPDALRVDANGTPLRKFDRIRHKKTGRIATVREPIEEFKSGKSVYTTYIKVHYDDKTKREPANPANFELIREGEEPASTFVNEAPTPSEIPPTPEVVQEAPKPLSEEEIEGLTEEELAEWQAEKAKLSPFNPINDEAEDSKTYELSITKKQAELAMIEIEASFGGGIIEEDVERAGLSGRREGEIYIELYNKILPTAMRRGGKFQLTPREMFVLQNSIELAISSREEEQDYLEQSSRGELRALRNLHTNIATIRRDLGLSVVSSDDQFDKERGLDAKYEAIKNQRARRIAELREQQEYAADLRDDETPTLEDLDRDPEEYEEEDYPPTKEQRRIISAIMTGKSVIVRALAGTGKTSTLKLAAKRLMREKPDANIVYVAFNKSVELEASSKMPKNVEARTADSIAYQSDVNAELKKKMDRQKNDPDSIPRTREEIADALDIPKELRYLAWPEYTDSYGNTIPEGEGYVVDLIRDAIEAWSISDQEKPSKGLSTALLMSVSKLLEQNGQPITWLGDRIDDYVADLRDPDGVFKLEIGHMTKFWALSNPDLGATGSGLGRRADIIFFDEAQDINPVLAKVIADQKLQKVYVGDGNQAIYGFRGAVDQLDKTEAPFDLPMTQSFRFGPQIANFANRFLDLIGSRYRLRGNGPEDARVGRVEDPDAILARTNAGVVRAAMQELEAGKRVAVSSKTKKELQTLVRTVRWFKEGGTKPRSFSADLAEFKTWDAVAEAADSGDRPKVKMIYNLVEETFQGNVNGMDDFVESLRIESQVSRDVDEEAPSSAFDGESGSIGSDLFWRVEGTSLILKGNTYDSRELIKGVKGARYNGTEKHWFFVVDDDDDRLDTLNKLRDVLLNKTEDIPEVVITTAHKSKGLEWDRVALFDDFFKPRVNPETGETIMPSAEEMRLNYVAATRGRKEIDPGGLDWIFDYSSENSGDPNRGEGMAMGLEMATPSPSEASNEDIANTVSATKTKLDEASEAVANLIIEQLEAGVAPWQKPWTGGNFLPVSYATGKSYNGSNIWHLLAWKEKNGWADNRWITRKQAEKLGGSVPPDAEGAVVIYSGRRTKKEIDEETGEEKEYTFFQSASYEVFNVEQVEGIEFETVETSPPVPVTEGEQQVLDLYKDKPAILNSPQDAAYYQPMMDTIMLPLREQFPNAAAYFETLVHELAHSTGHASRLDRSDLTDHYGNHRAYRGLEELIAEITVALVAGRLNIDFEIENVSSYAESWLKTLKNDKNMIFKATAAAQAAADYMLGDVGKNNGTPHTGEEGKSLVEPDFAAEPTFLSGKSGEEYADDLRELVKSGKPVVFKYIRTLKNGETKSSIADGVPIAVSYNPKSEKTNVRIISSRDGKKLLNYTLANVDSLTPEEIEEYRSSRETIADVGEEQEPTPVTDTEAPADAQDLPDAGETEVEVVEQPPAEDSGGDEPPSGDDGGIPAPPPEGPDEPTDGGTDIELTEAGVPLPAQTTWDRFYQAALRAQAIENPMDELEAVNRAQELAREEGFDLYEVPATTKSWQRGKGTRKSQQLWWDYVRRMGMTIRTSEDRNVGESGQRGEEIEEFFMEPPAGDFKTYTDDPDQFYEDVEIDDLNPPTPREQDAIEQYQDSNASLINDRLRQNPDFASEPIVENLDNVVGKGTLTEDTLLYRVVRMNIGEEVYEQFEDLQPGDVITDKGFMSTSASRSWASEYYSPPLFGSRFNSSVIIEIQAPAGTNGMVPHIYTKGDRKFDELKREYEFVLPRNTRLEVVSIDPVTRVITTRIV